MWYCSQVGTFGTESAVRKRGGSRNLPYLNAKPRQISVTEHVCVNSNKKVIRKDGNRKEETQCTAYVY